MMAFNDAFKFVKVQERESCLNNINLNLSLTSGFPKEKSRQSQLPQRRFLDRTYSKKSREKFLQGSLENVSSNPFGEFDTHQSTLRRSRSLAISREEIFTSLDIPTANRQRRPQLIPRAKLIDRSSLKDRCVLRDRNQETTQANDRQIIKRKSSSISSDYAVPQVNLQNPHKTYQSFVTAIRRASEENAPYAQINTFSTANVPDIDSLESNSYNKSSLHGLFRVSHDNLEHSVDFGLSLPNYYPDSRCDTDISLTDVSLTDNISIKEEGRGNKKGKKGSHRDNLSTNNLFYQGNSSPEDSCDNILYHDNISFGKNLLDDKYTRNSKPRTIRQYTPFHHDNFYEGKPRSLPNYTLSCDGKTESNYESNIYDIVEKPEEKIKIYEELAELADSSGGEAKLDSDFSQSDLNFDEINLNNDKIAKIIEPSPANTSNSYDTCFENNPIYDEIPYEDTNKIESSNSSNSSSSTKKASLKSDEVKSETEVSTESETKSEITKPYEKRLSKAKNIRKPNNKETLKTFVQVQADEGIYSVVRKSEKDTSNEYKTIVSVEEVKQESPRRHSHNYLKEFLESQKGSRKPLQNFLSKKISRAFGDVKKNLELESSNLVNNQYHSLPDLSISKNLRQCEKIDRKLRKCEKVPNLTKPTPTNNNRFIVNIGRHFDVTAESNIPVDFEVKISKIPKLRKAKTSKTKNSESKQQVFIDAVKNLNETLNGLSNLDENQNLTKPQVVEVTTKSEGKLKNSPIKRLGPPKFKKHRETQRTENSKLEKSKLKPLPKIKEVAETRETEDTPMDPQANKEFQEKLDTMRNYWGKMAKGSSESLAEIEPPKCKIVDVQTKVEEVIKKFEPKQERHVEKQESIVHATKQLFEPKLSPEKPEKLSPFVKESCTFFENPFFDKRGHPNPFESLNPNIVEIIEKEENAKDSSDKEKRVNTKLPILTKPHRPVAKTNSNTNEPEFDHVRYRVMKSDLFQKNIFANCQKESQFDGLMQYLQDYSFQELLIDNNIVIIEPIRSNIPHEGSPNMKTARNITNLLHKSHNGDEAGLCRRFYYHPVRVNKEMNEDELPNPDTVKQVRQFFEGGLKKSQSSQEVDKLTKKTVQYQSVDPDKDNCSATDSNSNPSNPSEIGSNDNLYDYELCCEQQYVSEDVLQKIRECGTSVTYYGGKVLNKRSCGNKSNPMTRTIMEEIRGDQVRECTCKISLGETPIRKKSIHDNDNKESYHGIKFKLLKSNSCSSRLELVGTQNLSEYKQKFFEKQKYLIDQKNRENQRKNSIITEKDENFIESTTIELKTSPEENAKENSEKDAPKIISATGKQMSQWGNASEEKTYHNINFNKSNQKVNYDYHNYEQVKSRTKKIDDMEFERYEIA